MKTLGAMKLVIYAISTALAACAGSAPPQRTRAPEPAAEPAPAPPEPPAQSAFEKRWGAACSAQGAVGQCPAPFERPGLFVEVEGKSEHAAPPFCGALEAPGQEAARGALAKKSKALKACFRGAEAGSWVELGASGEPIAAAEQARTPRRTRTETCVAKIVKGVFAGLGNAPPERLVVLGSAATKSGDQGLDKVSLDKVINANAAEVSACYDAALEVWPGLRGRIATSLVIWFDGHVALVRTGESTLDNAALECCINTAVGSWTFPHPADGSIALVTFPFTLGGAR
jgi:hypothetical protein